MAALGALKALHDFRLAPDLEPTMDSQQSAISEMAKSNSLPTFSLPNRNIPPFILANCRFTRRLWELERKDQLFILNFLGISLIYPTIQKIGLCNQM
jgi:hypothetical protein